MNAKQYGFSLPAFSFERIENGLTATFWKIFHSVFRKYRPSSKLILPQKGIRNYGNTCFLNSVLQAFASTRSLTAYFGAIGETRPSLLKFNKNLKHCMEALRDPLYSSRIDRSAKVIYEQLSRHRKMFGDRNEQDAEECLQALLSMMSIELMEARNANDHIGLALNRSVMPLKLPFEGWCSSTITCLKCHKSRPQKHQKFVDVSLSLQHLSSSNSRPNLYDCLEHFSFRESLSDVECLNCSYAELLASKDMLEDIFRRGGSKDIGDLIDKITYLEKNSHQLEKVSQEIIALSRIRSQASKQLKISRLPEVLCLHLSRRNFCSRSGRMTKNRFKVSFPARLDMAHFVEGDAASESASSLILGNNRPTSFDYDLRAVIVHHGDADSGHYTTYALLDVDEKEEGRASRESESDTGDILSPGRKWMHFSDENVVEVSEQEVLSSEAYLLFYDKV